MRRGARWSAVALALGPSLLLSANGRAAPADEPPPLHVEYAAPGNCPAESDFERLVRARTPLARFVAEETDDARPVQVVVRPMGVTYAGHLSIVGRSGKKSERDVEDARCADLVDALALVTALAVDPNATLAPSAPEATVVIPLIAPAPAPAPARAPATALAPSGTWTLLVGATFLTTAGIAKDVLAGGGAFGEVASPRPGPLSPTARLTLYAEENGAFVGNTTASFLLVAARADACPLRLGGTELALRVCGLFEFGAVRGEGNDTTLGVGVPGVEWWGDVGALVRARWVPGGRWFFVEIEGGASLPFNRSTFIYNHPIHTVDTPWVATPTGAVSAGARL